METRKSHIKWRFSGYYWLNQTTQIAQIADTDSDTYMDKDLAVIVCLQIRVWAPSSTPLKICRERISLQDSGYHKPKKVNIFMLFIPC